MVGSRTWALGIFEMVDVLDGIPKNLGLRVEVDQAKLCLAMWMMGGGSRCLSPNKRVPVHPGEHYGSLSSNIGMAVNGLHSGAVLVDVLWGSSDKAEWKGRNFTF